LSFLADLRQAFKVLQAVEAEPLDPELVAYVLALEDKRFLAHIGVDLLALARASFNCCRGRPKGGASTIDMQLVRTITDRRERTVRRKLREILLAILLRRRLGPTRILEAYLSIAVTGTDVKGMAALAAHLFAVPMSACTSMQKAMLASTLLVPAPREPAGDWWQRIERRAREANRRVTRSMARLEGNAGAPPPLASRAIMSWD
jgi:membrane peptidoglycan carboxypeptidase